MVRTGAEYIASLRDDRTVYMHGERVRDVTEHPALQGAIRSIASLYDLAAAPENRAVMTFPSPATGAPVNMSFLMPRTPEDLVARRRAHRLWADATFGMMGRSPDHVAGFMTGFALCPDLFARDGQRFGDNAIVSNTVDAHYMLTRFFVEGVKRAGKVDKERIIDSVTGFSLQSGNGMVRLRPEDRHADLNIVIAETRGQKQVLVKDVGLVKASSQCKG